MILDHDTGSMTGEVLTGDYAGRRVEEMVFEQLIGLLKVCRQDEKESARLIEAYLDREFDNWREQARSHGSRGPFPGGNMERAKALQVLGLQEGASTRLLIYAGKLIRRGISARDACRAAIVWAVVDDLQVQNSIEEVVASIFE